jgi:predicted nucleic acid-binding protein
MSGSSILLDTNIILYYLRGDQTLTPLLEENRLYISIITEIELLGYNKFNTDELKSVHSFIDYCRSVNISDDIKNIAIEMRRNEKLRLPDAIIFATSLALDIPFITADKDFEKVQRGELILYEK